MLPSEYIQKGWTRGDTARNKGGESVAYDDPNARSWCVLGAIFASSKDGTITLMQNGAIDKYLKQTIELLSVWNDQQETSEPVIKMLQEAEREVLGIG